MKLCRLPYELVGRCGNSSLQCIGADQRSFFAKPRACLRLCDPTRNQDVGNIRVKNRRCDQTSTTWSSSTVWWKFSKQFSKLQMLWHILLNNLPRFHLQIPGTYLQCDVMDDWPYICVHQRSKGHNRLLVELWRDVAVLNALLRSGSVESPMMCEVCFPPWCN